MSKCCENCKYCELCSWDFIGDECCVFEECFEEVE